MHAELHALMQELGLETFPTYHEGESLTFLEGTVRRYADETLGLPEEALAEIGRLQAKLESLASTVPLASPWAAPEARALDQTANSADETALR